MCKNRTTPTLKMLRLKAVKDAQGRFIVTFN